MIIKTMQNKRIVVYRRHHQNGLKYVSLGCCVMVACSHPFQRERERERERGDSRRGGSMQAVSF